MSTPRVVHCKKEPFDVYIGRPRPWEGLVGDWGNPFSHKENTTAQYRVATIEEAVQRYESWLLAQPELVRRARVELQGKVLGCWGCVPCHGDVLLRVANMSNCLNCNTEILLGSLATELDRSTSLCSACLSLAPAPGPWDQGTHTHVVGLDEVGWGALAGPLMVGVAATPRGWRWPGLRDSKDLSAAARERLVADVSRQMQGRVFVHIETMLVREFERFGNAEHALLETHRRAAERMVSALQAAGWPLPLVIVDGNRPVPGQRCQAMKNADDVVPAVMVAAIFAKVRRDRYMRGLHHAFPNYGFADSAGYGTDQHRDAIQKFGPCPAHRRNYQPVKGMLATPTHRRMQQLPLFPS